MRTDGRTVAGTLVRLDPERALAELQTSRDAPAITLAFEEIKSLHLTTPVELVHDPSSLNSQSEDMYSPSDSQDFEVEFKDGEKFGGPTRGYVTAGFGLFLYRLNQAGQAVRCFVPQAVMQSWRIGPMIGDMLVAEKAVTREQLEEALERQQALRGQRIGDYLTANEIVTPEQLATALERQKAVPMKRLGELLLEMELVTEKQLSEALAQQQKQPTMPLGQLLLEMTEERISEALSQQKKQRSTPLGQILLEMGIVDEATLKGVLARKLGIPVVNLTKFKIDPNAVRLIDATFAHTHRVVPIHRSPSGLVVATENPLDHVAIDRLRFRTQQTILPVLANRREIEAALESYYGPAAGPPAGVARAAESVSIGDLAGQLAAEPAPEQRVEDVTPSDNVLVRLVNKMIEDAYVQHASDIHVEVDPGRLSTRIRFRRDGVLVPYLEVPSNFRSALISRIKVMADMDISVHRKPQDGKIDFQRFGAAPVELRIVTIPTARGLEDVVMRLLTAARPLPLDQLDIAPEILPRLRALVEKPHGLFLVCGPTSSGKTTTLHSILALLNTPSRKIWTAEDPIEIAQTGLRQIQIQAATGWTFAAALRTLLRADPDVIMVGEMRDVETAKTAIGASLTGHLVLSTIHTNSAPESIVRLLDLGMDPFNFSDALLGVLGQRLARRLCKTCRAAYRPDDEELSALAQEYCVESDLDPSAVLDGWRKQGHGARLMLYRPKGCKACSGLGYSGRVGLHEFLVASPPVRRLVQRRAPAEAIAKQAAEEGMHTLKQDGISKVLAGLTDITQVRSVCG